jgi:hypothetical protein
MALATLSVDLVAKLASFEADLGKAARATQRTADQMAGAFGLIKSAAGGLAAGIGVAGIVAFTRSVVNSLDALNDLKDATGASVENISALEDVAIRTGTTFDTVGASLIKFNAALKNANPDSDIAAAFDSIGLSVKDLKALDPAEALRQTAVALAGFADDGNKARLTQELFGKSLREVAPFLKDLSEQGALVASVTTQQAEEAEKFNKELFAMQKNLQDVSRSLVGPVLTGLNGLIEKFREGQKAGEGFIVTLLRQTEIARLLGQAQPKAVNTGGASGSFESAENERARARLQRQGKLSLDFDGATKGGSKGGRGGSKPQAEQITESQRALAQYVEGLSRTLEKTENLTEVEKALNFLRFQGTTGQVPQVRQLVLGMAEQIDKAKELAELEKQRFELSRAFSLEAGDRVSAENEAYQDRIKALTQNTPSEVFKRQQADLEFLQQAYAATDITAQQYIESVRELYGLSDERIEKTKSLADELGLSFTSAFEDAIVGGKGLSGVLKGLEQDILRIVTRKLVTEPLGNAITGATGGAGGIGGFFSSIFGSIFGGGKALGGPVLAGTPYIVGERGPELFVPRASGNIVPNQRLAGAARSMVIHINPPAGMGRGAASQFAADVARQLRLADARGN